MCVDREKSLREGAFFFTRSTLFPPLDKRNTRDKAKGLRVASERYIGKLVVRYLSTLNRAQDSRQQYPHRMRRREGEIASRPSRLRYFYPTGWRSSLLLSVQLSPRPTITSASKPRGTSPNMWWLLAIFMIVDIR